MLTDTITRIRGRIAEVGCRQADIAQAIGINETLLNTYLRGRRPMPEGFEERVHATLDRLEAAERAAQEARERVLAETDDDGGKSMTYDTQILRRAEVLARVGLGKTTLYALIGRDEFPKPMRLSAKRVGWLESEVEDWLARGKEVGR